MGTDIELAYHYSATSLIPRAATAVCPDCTLRRQMLRQVCQQPLNLTGYMDQHKDYTDELQTLVTVQPHA